MLVTSNLREVFHHGLVDYGSLVVRLQQDEALANDVASADVAAQVYDSSIFQCFVE